MTGTTETQGDVLGYRAAIDPLHRNTWPITRVGDETVIGYLTEHITVNFDAPAPPPATNVWSWKFSDDVTARLEETEAKFVRAMIEMRPTFGTWREALEVAARVHEIVLIHRAARER
jgi:hypothetical protein